MEPGTRTDYERMAARYDLGRALPEEALAVWMTAAARFVTPRRGPVVLDVGTGTGVFAQAWARHFEALVVAVDPSSAMLQRAAAKGPQPGVHFARAAAERLPLRRGCCDAAWLSTVVHHIEDLHASARELRRVLRSGGRLLIRNAFSGRTDGITWLGYFPAARPIAERRWPPLDAVVATFEGGGFRVVAVERVRQQVASDLSAYCRRVAVRADSSLALISDEDFHAGLRDLERAAAAQVPPAPVFDALDLVVLE